MVFLYGESSVAFSSGKKGRTESHHELSVNVISLLEQDCWFQQDVATAHTENSTLLMIILLAEVGKENTACCVERQSDE
jgi:hypothetical protein